MASFIQIILVLLLAKGTFGTRYEPTWKSIDSRPLPQWYDNAKFGIFCHWGVYAVTAHREAWLWWYWKATKDPEIIDYMEKHFHGQSYADFASQFTAEDFNPAEFASIVKASGAKYFVFTSKHHEGFTMWPSNTSWNWNSVDIGPKRDIVGDLKTAIEAEKINFGLYFSQMDWFHPLYLKDATNNKSEFTEQISYPQMIELVNTYKPKVIWSDGDWDKTDDYWKSKEFLAWLYNERPFSSPVKNQIVVNDRWGKGVTGKHGGFLTFSDHYDPGHIVERKWENCMTLDKNAWGYRRDMKASDVHTVYELITQLIRTISCNGNMLLNVGPDKYGRIDPIFVDRLTEFGKFINTHEEAIFETKPWIHQNDSVFIWYTSKLRSPSSHHPPSRVFNPQETENTIIYAWILQYPINNEIHLISVKPTDRIRISLLGTDIKLQRKETEKGIIIDLSNVHWTQFPFKDAFILKIEYAASSHHNPLKHLRHQKLQKNIYNIDG